VTERVATAVIVAVPMRLGSISGGRFDLAPAAITAAVDRFVAHGPDEPARISELGVRLAQTAELGAIVSQTPQAAFDRIRRDVGASIEDMGGPIDPPGAAVILGGDNSITRPGVHAAAAGGAIERTGLLTLDAHHDLRDTGTGLTNGNPVRALLEDGLPGGNVVQVGIQPLANPRPASEVAREAGILVITADDVRARGIQPVIEEALGFLDPRVDAIYVDADVDVLDRAFAPACPGARPGGLSPAEVQAAVRRCGEHAKVRAIDIVEVDPDRDVGDVTVLAAASFVLAFASGLARRE
jgi:formiminoglutamase